MSEITVVARNKAKPGREKELEAALRAAVPPTHKEEGCIKYTLHRAVGDPSRLVVLERWACRADLDRHLSAPHIKALFQKSGPLLLEPPDIAVYEQLEEGDSAKGCFS